MECIYCHEESEFRRSIMEELCTLPYSTVYVFRSQTENHDQRQDESKDLLHFGSSIMVFYLLLCKQ